MALTKAPHVGRGLDSENGTNTALGDLAELIMIYSPLKIGPCLSDCGMSLVRLTRRGRDGWETVEDVGRSLGEQE